MCDDDSVTRDTEYGGLQCVRLGVYYDYHVITEDWKTLDNVHKS